MSFGNASRIDALTATKKVKATDAAGSGFATGVPVQVYPNESGVLYAISGLIDGSSRTGRWGIVSGTCTSGGVATVIVKGAATTVATSGVAGYMVTAISAAGEFTNAAVASGNADLSLGVATSASALVIY